MDDIHAISLSFITIDDLFEMVRERRVSNVSFEFRIYKLHVYHYRILAWIFHVAEEFSTNFLFNNKL